MLRMRQRGLTDLQIAKHFATTESRVRQLLAHATRSPADASADALKKMGLGRMQDAERGLLEQSRSETADARKLQMIALRVEGMTFAQIGKHFGVTRERVRQVIGSEGKEAARVKRQSKGQSAKVLQVELRKREAKARSDERREAQQIEGRRESIKALQLAATYAHPLTGSAYDNLVTIGEVSGPSRQTIANRFGSWVDACEAAGVECGRTLRIDYTRRWTPSEMLAYLRICRDEIGRAPTVREYEIWARTHDGAPSEGTIRKQFGTWRDVKKGLT